LPDDLAGRHVLVLPDQGLGDELFFLRFIPALQARGARVTYRPDARLRDMLERARLLDRLIAPGEAAGDTDECVSVGDLPFLLGMKDGDTPPPSIGLAADAARIQRLGAWLATLGPAPYIGLTWRAGTRGVDRLLAKEVPLDGLARAVAPLAGTVLSLQRDPLAGETAKLAAHLNRPVHDLSALNGDLEDMLALVGLLDHQIGVSNTNLHLRAATGGRAHVLVPSPPEFRWMASGAQSPWFPGWPVYRQAVDGDWDEAFARLGADLAALG